MIKVQHYMYKNIPFHIVFSLMYILIVSHFFHVVFYMVTGNAICIYLWILVSIFNLQGFASVLLVYYML